MNTVLFLLKEKHTSRTSHQTPNKCRYKRIYTRDQYVLGGAATQEAHTVLPRNHSSYGTFSASFGSLV